MADINDNDFMTQIGRAEKDGRACTFIRVVHVPTGKERTVVGLGKKGGSIRGRLIREIVDELEAGR